MQKPEDTVDHIDSGILIYLDLVPTNFKFVIPGSLKACLKRLEYEQATEVTPSPEDSNIYTFRIKRRDGRLSPLVATGTLKSISEESTLVDGSVAPMSLLGQIPLVGVIIVISIWFSPFKEIICPNALFFIVIGLSVTLTINVASKSMFIRSIRNRLRRSVWAL